MNTETLSSYKKEIVGISVSVTYLTFYYARKAYLKRQERLRQERLEAQLTAVNETLDKIANLFHENKF